MFFILYFLRMEKDQHVCMPLGIFLREKLKNGKGGTFAEFLRMDGTCEEVGLNREQV